MSNSNPCADRTLTLKTEKPSTVRSLEISSTFFLFRGHFMTISVSFKHFDDLRDSCGPHIRSNGVANLTCLPY